MILFPNSKVNLGLIITGKREDGFHNIETVFYPIPLKDALEILPAKPSTKQKREDNIGETILQDEVTFTSGGINIYGPPADNLCVKAYHLLKKNFPVLPPVNIHLHKAVPIGAGLGGGSADAAFTLLGLNEKYTLGLSQEQLIRYAIQLGSDCPFFIINQPCIGFARGEVLQPVSVDLSMYQMILINPGIHINTGWAFSQFSKPLAGPIIAADINSPLKKIISGPVDSWKMSLHNEFEQVILKKHPEITSIKETLYANGAVYASMSGSGSSVYGLFHKDVKVKLQFPPHYFMKNLLL